MWGAKPPTPPMFFAHPPDICALARRGRALRVDLFLAAVSGGGVPRDASPSQAAIFGANTVPVL